MNEFVNTIKITSQSFKKAIMQQQFSNFKEFFKSIQILHAAMFFGMVMILVLLKFLMADEVTSDGDLLFPAIGIGFAISALGISQILFNKKMESLKKERLTVPEKLTIYREAYILKLALLEGPALICIILHFLGGNPILFYTSLFMIFIFAYERPIEGRIKQQLNLHAEDLVEK